MPTIKGMKAEGAPFVGVLYAGVMIDNNEAKVLEFNVRFGDPETQAILPRMKSDLLELILKCIDSKLDKQAIQWDTKACVCVVIASRGYPGKYEKGKSINGLDKIEADKKEIIFHAGTKKQDGKVITNGGRVLGVTAMGDDIKQAIENTYIVVEKISFDGMFFRRDIGKKALGEVISS